VLRIDVGVPVRTDDRYEFLCRVGVERSLTARLRQRRSAPERGTARRVPDVVRFGFRSTNARIEHHPVWDAIYPLMSLTRHGGPLLRTGHRRARIRFAYPIPEPIREFYVRRAQDLGLNVEVVAKSTEARFEGGTDRHVVAFGGGKESRTILGVLREMGADPLIVTTGARHVPDLPDALVSDAVDGALADRVMPALMRAGRHLYIGGTMGGSHRVTPWHRYYDMSSPAPLRELSRMLAQVGVATELHAPLALLPPNVGQWILHDRYPELFRWQQSVRDGHETDKNLHIALCRYHRGIPIGPECPPELFARLLERFVGRETRRPRYFGFRRAREVISREMRAMVHRHRDEPPFATVRDRIPDDWAGDWIDYLHTYVDPDPLPGFLSVFLQYAPPIAQAPAGARLWRIPV
jgi:hypothetical protein